MELDFELKVTARSCGETAGIYMYPESLGLEIGRDMEDGKGLRRIRFACACP